MMRIRRILSLACVIAVGCNEAIVAPVGAAGEWYFAAQIPSDAGPTCSAEGALTIDAGTVSASSLNVLGACAIVTGTISELVITDSSIAFDSPNCEVTGRFANPDSIVGSITCDLGSTSPEGTFHAERAGPPATIAVSPAAHMVPLAVRLRLDATVRDADGHRLVGRDVVWSSSDNAIATVVIDDGVAFVQPQSAGVATITASLQGLAATSTITVTATLVPTFVTISAGRFFTCATTASGELWCWGAGPSGSFGIGPRPTRVVTDVQFASVTAGSSHACGVALTGAAYCWGSNNWYLLGHQTFPGGPIGPAVAPPTSFLQLAASSHHTCALTESFQVMCWGANDGRLGRETPDSVATPAPVESSLSFRRLDAGDASCASTESGELYCWGFNFFGAVGIGTTGGAVWRPTQVAGGLRVSDIAAGEEHVCALDIQGAAYCWGRNQDGQLGVAGDTNVHTPTIVLGGGIYSQITAGGRHTCGISSAGLASCWGDNTNGQLGDGTQIARRSPTPVAGGLPFRAISAATSHTCGITTSGITYCWGQNDQGQIGDGTTVTRLVPTWARPQP